MTRLACIRILLFLLTGIMTSCITTRSNSYLQEGDNLPQYAAADYSAYRLRPNDQLSMRVLTLDKDAAKVFNTGSGNNNSSNAYSYRVYEDGTVDFPFLNGVKVAGLTLREASAKLQDTLRTMVPDATVKLAMTNECFYFVGEGGSGAFTFYKERLNIFQALALVGDLASNGDRRRVRVVRPDPAGGRPEVREFDLRSRSVIGSEYYWVYPNDVIYVSSIPGDFWKVEDYSAAVGTLSSSISFLVTVINLGLSF